MQTTKTDLSQTGFCSSLATEIPEQYVKFVINVILVSLTLV